MVRLCIRPDEDGLPAPLVTVTGEALVRQAFPNVMSVLNMCLFQHDLLEYAVHLQQVSIHANWVIKDGIVVDVIPDFIDLTGENIIMPPPAAVPVWPAVPAVHQMLVYVPVPQLALPAPAVIEDASEDSDVDTT